MSLLGSGFTPEDQAILALGLGLLGNRSRNFAGAVGDAGLLGLQTYGQASALDTKRKLYESQIEENKSQAAERKAKLALAEREQKMMDDILAGRMPGVLGGGMPAAGQYQPPPPPGSDFRRDNVAPGAGSAGVATQQMLAQNRQNAQAQRLGGVPSHIAALSMMQRTQPLATKMWELEKPEWREVNGEWVDIKRLPQGTRNRKAEVHGNTVLDMNDAANIGRNLPVINDKVAVQVGPDGRMAPIPGSLASYGAFDAQRQRQQAQYATPIPVTGPDGNTILTRPDRLADALGGPGGGASRQGGAPGAVPAQGAPGLGMPVQSPAAAAAASAGAVLPASNIKLGNEAFMKRYQEDIVPAGSAAKQSIADAQALKALDLKTGWGAEAKAQVANVLTTFGIAPAQAQLFAASAQAFRSVANNQVLLKQIAQKGPQTEADARRMEATVAQLGNTPQANQLILDYMIAGANMAVKRQSYYERALQVANEEELRDYSQIDTRWRRIGGSLWDDPVMARWKELRK